MSPAAALSVPPDQATYLELVRGVARTLRLGDVRIEWFPTDSSHNVFARIRSAGADLIVKAVFDEYLCSHPDSVLNEFRIMTVAHPAGLSPRPVHVDLADRLLVQEFVAGTSPATWDETTLRLCSSLGARLMTLPVNTDLPVVHTDYGDDIDAHLRTVRELTASRDAAARLLRLGEQAREFCASVQDRLDELPLRIAHNDIAPDNIIMSAAGPVMIDFEAAGLSKPDFLVGQLAVDAAIDDALAGSDVRPLRHLCDVVRGAAALDVSDELCRARVVERLLQNAAYGLRQADAMVGRPSFAAYARRKSDVADFCERELSRRLTDW